MSLLVGIIFFGALGTLGVATFALLSAAELLKQYAEKNSEASIARYHSKPIAVVAVVLGVISYFIAENSDDTLLVALLIPCALILVAGMLNASWWFIYRPTVVEYTKQQQYEKRIAQQK